MKRLCLTMLIGVVLFAGYAVAQDKVVLSNGEWKPYLSKELKHFGVASHIVTEAYKREGVITEYKWYGESWKRAYKDTKDGKVDGSLIWSKKPERLIEMYYSEPVIKGKKDVFYHLKSNKFSWNTIEDLKGKRVGGTAGYAYGPLIEEAVKKGYITMDLVSKESLNLQKLLKGRIDLFLSGVVVGSDMIKEKLTPEQAALITFHEKPYREATYHLILTKAKPANKAFLDKFNAGLKKLQGEGLYDQYLKESEAGKYEK